MKKILFILFYVVVMQIHVQAQQITAVNISWVDSIKTNKNDTLYIINFWATWCKPCVEELPYFIQLSDTLKDKKVKVILVNTDMKKELDTKVKSFLVSKKIGLQVIHINETNANNWIDKVNTEWSGAIPATWFIRGSKGFEHFKEGEFTFDELMLLTEQILMEK